MGSKEMRWWATQVREIRAFRENIPFSITYVSFLSLCCTHSRSSCLLCSAEDLPRFFLGPCTYLCEEQKGHSHLMRIFLDKCMDLGALSHGGEHV